MKITVLMENTACDDALCTEHGLSLYIETLGKKILFDMGMSDKFIQNANSIGIDATDVDFAILSHGHFDHGGGISAFLADNNSAPLYIRKMAFDTHLADNPSGIKDIGIDATLLPNKQFIFTGETQELGEGLSLFSLVPAYEPIYASSGTQREILDGEIVADRFHHEQNLVICENNKYTLIAGCAHSGIYNILTHFHKLFGRYPDVVIGGFHLMIPSLQKSLPDEIIDNLADKLNTHDTKYYTCHCTGSYAFDRLKTILQGKIDYISTGSIIQI